MNIANKESYPVQEIPGSDIWIIGNGEIGDKAKQLVEKTGVLREIGFSTPPRYVLAEGFFDAFFQNHNLGRSLENVDKTLDIENKIKNGRLDLTEFQTFSWILGQLRDYPALVIRSSGDKDARGTGVYYSGFCPNDLSEATVELQKVLASYFSNSAEDFRKQAKAKPGFGIIVEPVVGQDLIAEHGSSYGIAPILSGNGYTSIATKEGYLDVVPGLGCGVINPYVEKISRSKLVAADGSLENYIQKEYYLCIGKLSEDGMHYLVKPAPRQSELLRTIYDHDHLQTVLNDFWWGVVFRGYKKVPQGSYVDFGLLPVNEPPERNLLNTNLLPLFAMMEELEQRIGKPQRLEWAMTREQGEEKHWVIQIADSDEKIAQINKKYSGDVLFAGHFVTGNGVRHCRQIVACFSEGDISLLRRFNKKSRGYTLIYEGGLIDSFYRRHNSPVLEFADFSNAAVVLQMIDDSGKVRDTAHFRGLIEETGKFHGALDPNFSNWGQFGNNPDQKYGLYRYKGNFTVVADKSHDQITVYNSRDH